MRPVHWIETELSRHFKNLDPNQGADLDQNGKIEGSERTDLNNDGNVDSAEWQKFVADNRAALEKLGGFFKTYYSAGTAFKPDNPIHDLMAIEAEENPAEAIAKAYRRMAKVLGMVRKRLKGRKLDPQEKLGLVYSSMRDLGIEFRETNDTSFVRNVNEGMSALDCDTSSYMVIAVAHEFGWPVHLVHIPKHVFVRWDDGGDTRFNMDFGHILDDSYYVNRFGVCKSTVGDCLYLKNLDYTASLSQFYLLRPFYRLKDERIKEAIADCDRAIELDTNNCDAYVLRAAILFKLEKHEEVIADCDRATALDPDMAPSYVLRALSKASLGMYAEAIADLDKMPELDSEIRRMTDVGLGLPDVKELRAALELELKKKQSLAELESFFSSMREAMALSKSEVKPAPSCLCNAVGQTGSSSPPDPSLLSLLLTVIFD